MLSAKESLEESMINPANIVPPNDQSWVFVKNTYSIWCLDKTTPKARTTSELKLKALQNVLKQFNLDQLPDGSNGLTLFDEDNGQTYRLVRLSTSRIGLSQTCTAKYLQQYLAEREALFFKSQTISVGEMATTLAHEMNQPIGAIQNLLNGISTRLQRENTDIDEINKAVHRTIEQTQYAARIITRIRDFTQARQPNFETLTVHALLQDSAKLLDWIFSTRNITLEYSEDNALNVRGDYTMLQQVITNLLRNAIEAIEAINPKTGKITLSAELREDKVLIQIKDNGIGLQNPQDLFTPFATSKPDGMGVGLNICRSFIELHNGRLWLIPNDSAGSTANIQLPYMGEDNAK